MAKKDYFSHDFYARTHLRDVRKDFGMEGCGIYWCIVEILHEQGGSIKETDIAPIAYDLRCDVEKVDAILRNYGMFQIKKGKISSTRVIENLNKREEISRKRREAAETRWGAEGEELPELELDEDDAVPKEEHEEAKKFYIAALQRAFDDWSEDKSDRQIFGHNIWDYHSLFKSIIEEVKTKDYVVIRRKNVPVYHFLRIIQRHISKNGRIENLDTMVKDVEKRYMQGKIKNKTNYMIAALYNTALITQEIQ